MDSVRHNKKRNVGIVYELLIRHLSRSLVEGDRGTAARVLAVIRRGFSPGTAVSEELAAFRAVRSLRGSKAAVARGVVRELGRAVAAIDRRRLHEEKTALVHAINREFGRDFFGRYEVPEYRAMAAVQAFLDRAGVRGVRESAERAELEEAIVAYVSSPAPVASRPGDVGPLAYGMAVERYRERYADRLGPRQRRLIEGYVAMELTGDARRLSAAMAADRTELLTELARAASDPDVARDPEAVARMSAARTMLSEVDPGRPSAGSVEEMIMFHDLSRELASR